MWNAGHTENPFITCKELDFAWFTLVFRSAHETLVVDTEDDTYMIDHVGSRADCGDHVTCAYSFSHGGLKQTQCVCHAGVKRNAVAHSFYVDLDFVNCHPTLFSQRLDQYCGNRTEVLGDIDADAAQGKTVVLSVRWMHTVSMQHVHPCMCNRKWHKCVKSRLTEKDA